ncbi:MAG: 3-phosphoshikimate 1-carboxyvinyltransferase [Clostridia bacterium]|nr:3-phosphoshikimate 1-carboxyvinyltransferase [Clostridia bacterium]
MMQTIKAGTRRGAIRIPSSKSLAHRAFICAALSESPVDVRCTGISKDIGATVDCLRSLGAVFSETGANVFRVTPVNEHLPDPAIMRCGESGSTLRFLLPIAAALGRNACFFTEGRLAERPIDELIGQLARNGAVIVRKEKQLECFGRLDCGVYTVPGDVSSQYISGLLFALPLLEGHSRLEITGKSESSPYIALTESVLETAGIVFEKNKSGYSIRGKQKYRFPERVNVEGDWSNAAFFLCMGAFSPEGIAVSGLSPDSRQGDRSIVDILKKYGADVMVEEDVILVKKKEKHPMTIDVSEIPDLVPVLCVLLAAAEGDSLITNARRLRFKESDRLKTTADMINALGGFVSENEDGIAIKGRGGLTGGTVDPQNDHRIAMAAAAAASICEREVRVINSECTEKSYPSFWKDLSSLEVI